MTTNNKWKLLSFHSKRATLTFARIEECKYKIKYDDNIIEVKNNTMKISAPNKTNIYVMSDIKGHVEAVTFKG